MKRKRLLILTIIIIFILIIPFSSAEAYNIRPQAVKGVLDLSRWNFVDDGPVRIKGEFELYWEKLLAPDELKKDGPFDRTGYIKVPGVWDGYSVDGRRLTGMGYATYRLIINWDKKSEPVAVKMMDMSSSYNLYINGIPVMSNGVVGKAGQTSIPQYLPGTAEFYLENGENELILQVSNFYHRSGGAWGQVTIGTRDQIHRMSERNTTYELLMFGAFFVMAWNNLVIYIFLKKNKSPLYFAVICFIVSLRTIITGERYLVHMMPSISWDLVVRLEYMTFYAGITFFIVFIDSLYKKILNMKILRFIQWTGTVFSMITIFTEPIIFTKTLYVFQVFSLLVIICSLYVVTRACIQRLEGSYVILVSCTAASIFMLNDMLLNNTHIDNHYLAPFGYIIFLFAQSIVLAKKFSRAFKKAEEYAEKNMRVNSALMELNMNLEQKVDERTRELQEKNRLLNRMAITDGLTGLYNHKYIYGQLEERIFQSQNYGSSLSIIMFDIDYFKLVNDKFGHQTGDRVLVKVAQTLKLILRETDIVGRYGGEEFLIILPDTESRQAYIIAERIRDSIESMKFEEPDLHITISGGVVEVQGEDALKIVAMVDKMLYKAKGKGRNHIELSTA